MNEISQNKVKFPALRDIRYPVHKSAAQLEPYLEAIVENIKPRKIILFGSQAYGRPTEHSDFDLLILRDGMVSEKESNLEIRRLFWDIYPALPFTVLSKTPEEFEQRVAEGSPFYEEIFKNGLELYAA